MDVALIDKVTGVTEWLTTVKKETFLRIRLLLNISLAHYVKRREGYNYFSLQHDYDFVMAYSAENVAADYNALINSDQSQSYLQQG